MIISADISHNRFFIWSDSIDHIYFILICLFFFFWNFLLERLRYLPSASSILGISKCFSAISNARLRFVKGSS
jgi:hypothetical protein